MVEEEKVDVQRQSPRSPLRQGPDFDPLWTLRIREQRMAEWRKTKRDSIIAVKRSRLYRMPVLQLNPANPRQEENTSQIVLSQRDNLIEP